MTTLITREQLYAEIEAGAVTVVDALGGDSYAKQHLPGAIPLVEDDVADHASTLLPDRAAPIRSGSSFVGLGTSRHRVVFYPISHPDEDGLADINWIAEKTYDTGHDWTKTGWFRPIETGELPPARSRAPVRTSTVAT